jgi:hypothetical protein
MTTEATVTASGHPGYRKLREQALAMALETQRLLEQLVERPDHIEGSPPGEAFSLIEGVIAYLTPDDEDTTSNGRGLRVVGSDTSDARP